jgi:hypothetical protein
VVRDPRFSNPVVSTEQPVESPNSTKTERTDSTVTEVPSALQSDESIVATFEETISSTLKVEDGALNNSILEVESGGSSPIDGDLRSSGSDVNSLRGPMDSEVVGSNNGTKSEKANSDTEYDVRKICGMDKPDIKLETPGASSSSNTTS